jgi:hypothetical protein
MKTMEMKSRTVGASLSVGILLFGCGAPQATTPSGATPQPASTRAVRGSWMKPGTSGQDLLYTAGGENGRGIVYVYTYPQGALVGTLTGMIQPSGVCTDSAGNVFIVAYTTGSLGSSTIYEYAHGGTSPVAMLSDPGVALGCAVDPKTGNLAVANTSDFTNPYEDDWGDIAIYPEARGNPKIYYDDGFPAFYNCGYDNEGNLYVSAFPYNGRITKQSWFDSRAAARRWRKLTSM